MRHLRVETLAALLLLGAIGGAIVGTLTGAKVLEHQFPERASTGACADALEACIASGDVLDIKKLDVVTLSVQINPAGAPTGCAYAVEGSLDGVSWMVMGSTSDCTPAALCAAGAACRMIGTESKPVRYIRGNLTTLSGGTTPSVTAILRGVTR